jgi:hypothetical protein
VQVRKIPTAEAGQPYDNPAGCAQPEVASIEIGQTTTELYTAWSSNNLISVELSQLFSTDVFEARGCNGKKCLNTTMVHWKTRLSSVRIKPPLLEAVVKDHKRNSLARSVKSV